MSQDGAFSQFIDACQTRVNAELELLIDHQNVSAKKLKQAMQYSVFNGGKRVRPILVYASAQACNAEFIKADRAAAAVEMIHAYSLVHDDLPAMDDDALRRGKPTCHIEFDEATAILAGDALQTLAFEAISDRQYSLLTDGQKLHMIQILSKASGLSGMCGGQSIDLEAVGHSVDLSYLENMHNHKTGALIRASVLLGAYCQPDINNQQLEQLSHYASAIGLAFQVQDDVLDVVSDTATLGKAQGADEALNKPTYVSLLGLEGAQTKAKALCEQSMDAIREFGQEANRLRSLSRYIIERKN